MQRHGDTVPVDLSRGGEGYHHVGGEDARLGFVGVVAVEGGGCTFTPATVHHGGVEVGAARPLPVGEGGGALCAEVARHLADFEVGEVQEGEFAREGDQGDEAEDVSMLGLIVHSMQSEINMGDDAVDPASS